MTERNHLESENARASPVGDAQGPRLSPVINGQGLLSFERTRLKKRAQRRCRRRREGGKGMRVGTLNVGTMTGKGREIADLMERRRVSVLCVQETRWKGDKARELGDGYKLLYSGANKEGRNGVGIVLSKSLKDNIVSVKRVSDRIMVIKLCMEGEMVNIACVYAPQAGCEEEEKESFWEEMDQELSGIPAGERLIIGGDMNGHIGRNRVGIERVHGGWGVGMRNADGERLVDCFVSFDLAIVNTWFEKGVNQYITYKSGERES